MLKNFKVSSISLISSKIKSDIKNIFKSEETPKREDTNNMSKTKETSIRKDTNNKSKSEKTPKKRDIKNSYKPLGTLIAGDWITIKNGIEILEKKVGMFFEKQEKEIIAGEKDVSAIKKSINTYQNIIKDCMNRLTLLLRTNYNFKKEFKMLPEQSKIKQAVRDGIILKQETRTEIINGKEKEIKYDTSMTTNEVTEILRMYERDQDRLNYNKLIEYFNLGLSVLGILGTIYKNSKSNDKSESGTKSKVSIGIIACSALKLFKELIIKDSNMEKYYSLRDTEWRLQDDLLDNEQMSDKAEKDAIDLIYEKAVERKDMGNKINNIEFLYETTLDLVSAVITGAYISKKIVIKENGKIDGRSLASAIMEFNSMNVLSNRIYNTIDNFKSSKKEDAEFVKICEKVQEILKQIDEKVYPLEGAKHSFDSLSIQNLEAKFYPKTNYDTGETNYSLTIKIPEFSMKRGDVVLLSGESGTGKSTFLRYLKRGDINNRKEILIDKKEKVDNLGSEYISFRPSINLGNETNVLYQITGKNSVSDLTDDMKTKLEDILRELKFNNPNLLEELASKKFMEFSTGQQRRLALSKMFYRIDDGKSVIIVDEPVGNVEDSLIREQLEMIKEYAQKQNVMLLLTTHRLNLAEDLATKRYNINKDGVLEEVPIIEKDDDIEL